MYDSLWLKFVEYISENVGTEIAESLDEAPPTMPEFICAWIFTHCDIPDHEKSIRLSCGNQSYSQALKMRASISFHYNDLGRGSDSWHQAKDGS
jgi:hypothetical protein